MNLRLTFIIDIIKNQQNDFLVIVQLLGEMLIEQENNWIEMYNNYEEMGSDDWDLLSHLEIISDDLEFGGYEVYQSTANKIFIENQQGFLLLPDGTIVYYESKRDNQNEIMDSEETNILQNIPPEKFSIPTTINLSIDLEESLKLINDSKLLNNTYIETIETAFKLLTTGKYLQSLQILYPNVEHLINSMLINAGENPERFKGMKAKVRWLENDGLLPDHISTYTGIIEGRNKTLHGNLIFVDDNLTISLCYQVITYLQFLLTNYNSPNTRSNKQP